MTENIQTMPRLSLTAQSIPDDILGPILAEGTDPSFISFGGGLPCPEGLPVEAMRKACDEVLRSSAQRALQYSGPQGEIELREAVARYETEQRGTPTTPDEVLITSGSQQGLDLCARAFCDPGSRILVQRPTYIGALEAFNLSRPAYVELPEGPDGLEPEAIGEEARGARFAYILPTFSNPTGRTLGRAAREALAERARSLDFWILEDDPYGELWYRKAPPCTIRSLAPERTIRMSSFSKILAPGIRLGYITGPARVIRILTLIQSFAVLSTPAVNQLAAARVLSSGLMETHLPEVRAIYREHAEAMLSALEELMPRHPEIHWTHPEGGMFIWLHLPKQLDTFAMMQRAIEKKILYLPGQFFYALRPDVNCIRLAFVTVRKDLMREGVKRLSSLIRDELHL
ncbi:PLP-dependent aminotransferase family protein [Mesosutterella sp. AGMB02718]|uniref:PLP-dependent aminotransferase family protein n=1 Tax=Mesosutterella faecium TaxID=2925194 RepID=A0ABT7IQ18_9BURK|nr:PLP-dependent aminotransferase family protein [Mesosutterella sp. AGMB02718]MDL2059357.1 PLP-dependent aminotransferase family protein [Mesosutterella sp. AGMB02718]